MPHPPASDIFDWDQNRAKLRKLFGALAGGAEPDLLDDLVQEACVRLLRIVRREAIRETDAVLATVARRTWYDHLRRAVRTRERFRDLGDAVPDIADPSPHWETELGDPAERLSFVVQEIFVGRGADECLELLRHFLAAAGWQQLATGQGVAYATLRKRWSRCLTVARTTLAADADLAPWLD